MPFFPVGVIDAFREVRFYDDFLEFDFHLDDSTLPCAGLIIFEIFDAGENFVAS